MPTAAAPVCISRCRPLRRARENEAKSPSQRGGGDGDERSWNRVRLRLSGAPGGALTFEGQIRTSAVGSKALPQFGQVHAKCAQTVGVVTVLAIGVGR